MAPMTADRNQNAAGVDAPAVHTEGTPPEWLARASAIERREGYRYRIAKRPDRTRLVAALTPDSGEGLDPSEATDFVEEIRRGVVPTEVQDGRRWPRARKHR